MKKSVFCFLTAFLTIFLVQVSFTHISANIPAAPTDHNCYYYGFYGSTNRFSHKVSTTVNKETNSASGIEWDSSTLKGLNLYFSIKNADSGKQLKEVLFKNSDSGCFEITFSQTYKGGNYELHARRQNFWDFDFTHITGSWRP